MKRRMVLTALVLFALAAAPVAPAAATAWENGIAAPTASAAASGRPAFSAEAYQSEVLRLVNQQRAARSLRPLTATSALAGMAAVRAQESSVRFSHTRPNGSGPASLFAQYRISFSSAGENLACGYPSPDAVVSAWMLSPEHRGNILNAAYEYTGVGVYRAADGGLYWAQLFYRP